MPPQYQPHDHDRLAPALWHARRHMLVVLRREMERAARAAATGGRSETGEAGTATGGAPGHGTILDYGCGARPYRPLFAPRFERYLGADLAGNPEADLAVGPAGELPLGDGAVDCVLSSQVLEHVSAPALYLAEAARVLRPGGALVLSTHGVWPYHPDPCDYWRWTREGLRLQIERAGFAVESLRGVLGNAGTVLQQIQDAIRPAVPRFLRPPYYLCFQTLVALADSVRGGERSNNACTYVVVARKPSA